MPTGKAARKGPQAPGGAHAQPHGPEHLLPESWPRNTNILQTEDVFQAARGNWDRVGDKRRLVLGEGLVASAEDSSSIMACPALKIKSLCRSPSSNHSLQAWVPLRATARAPGSSPNDVTGHIFAFL